MYPILKFPPASIPGTGVVSDGRNPEGTALSYAVYEVGVERLPTTLTIPFVNFVNVSVP